MFFAGTIIIYGIRMVTNWQCIGDAVGLTDCVCVCKRNGVWPFIRVAHEEYISWVRCVWQRNTYSFIIPNMVFQSYSVYCDSFLFSRRTRNACLIHIVPYLLHSSSLIEIEISFNRIKTKVEIVFKKVRKQSFPKFYQCVQHNMGYDKVDRLLSWEAAAAAEEHRAGRVCPH